MKTSLCLAVPLLLASGGAVAMVDARPAPTAALAFTQDAYDKLHAEFSEELAEWEEALEDAADARAREKLQRLVVGRRGCSASTVRGTFPRRVLPLSSGVVLPFTTGVDTNCQRSGHG